MRTTPGTGNFLAPIEDSIRNKLIPALTGRSAISDVEREQLALPCRLGGLAIPDLTSSLHLTFKPPKIFVAQLLSSSSTDNTKSVMTPSQSRRKSNEE